MVFLFIFTQTGLTVEKAELEKKSLTLYSFKEEKVFGVGLEFFNGNKSLKFFNLVLEEDKDVNPKRILFFLENIDSKHKNTSYNLTKITALKIVSADFWKDSTCSNERESEINFFSMIISEILKKCLMLKTLSVSDVTYDTSTGYNSYLLPIYGFLKNTKGMNKLSNLAELYLLNIKTEEDTLNLRSLTFLREFKKLRVSANTRLSSVYKSEPIKILIDDSLYYSLTEGSISEKFYKVCIIQNVINLPLSSTNNFLNSPVNLATNPNNSFSTNGFNCFDIDENGDKLPSSLKSKDSPGKNKRHVKFSDSTLTKIF